MGKPTGNLWKTAFLFRVFERLLSGSSQNQENQRGKIDHQAAKQPSEHDSVMKNITLEM
jgi:hypothetical protein